MAETDEINHLEYRELVSTPYSVKEFTIHGTNSSRNFSESYAGKWSIANQQQRQLIESGELIDDVKVVENAP